MESGIGHLVYFLKAHHYKWVKVGRSRDVLTLDRRMRFFRGSLPFRQRLLGVSSGVSEARAHSDLAAHRIRGEWFKWNEEIRRYVRSVADVFHLERDGSHHWESEVVASMHAKLANERAAEIAPHLWMLHQADGGARGDG
jgi:hypothetical protein